MRSTIAVSRDCNASSISKMSHGWQWQLQEYFQPQPEALPGHAEDSSATKSMQPLTDSSSRELLEVSSQLATSQHSLSVQLVLNTSCKENFPSLLAADSATRMLVQQVVQRPPEGVEHVQ